MSPRFADLLSRVFRGAAVLFLIGAEFSMAVEPGETLLALDMASTSTRAVTLPVGASWTDEGPVGGVSLRIAVPADRVRENNIVGIPLDLRPWRGARVLLTCQARAENVTPPLIDYNGIKCQLHWVSPAKGPRWFNENKVYGTFPWRELSVVAYIDDDATRGVLNLGIQDSSGTAWIADVRITALRVKPERPAAAPSAAPAYKGHDLPRLRGVMSPVKFNAEDFTELKKWNANLIRWQLVNRNWGKAGADQDMEVYDRWLDGRLDELAQVLDAARDNGLKVVVDMHSPPGGRLPDSTLRMVLEKPFQDHFVEVWRRIVTRFKGHPAIWAYDLINEPVQNRASPPGVADCIAIQVLAAKAIREIDPDTTILIEADQWTAPDAFAFMTPVDVPHVAYTVHMYWPGQFTHQGVNNTWGVKGGTHSLSYPGTLGDQPLDKEAIRRQLEPVREFQLAYNVHIYVGEFGAIRWAPGADRYLSDVIEIFEEYGWDWSYHAFREWPGWSVEHADLPYSMTEHPKAEQPTARARVLKKWFLQNIRP